MIIHLFGSNTPVGAAFQYIYKLNGYKNIFPYSRKVNKEDNNYCDMNDPYQFSQKKLEEKSIIVSFAPIWITSEFLKKLKEYEPDFFQNVEKIIICSSSSFLTKRFAFNKKDQLLFLKLKKSQDEIKQLCNHNKIKFTIIQPTMVYGSFEKYKDKNFSFLLKIMRCSPFLFLPKRTGKRQPISCYQLANVAFQLVIKNDFFNTPKNEFLLIGGDKILSYKQMITLLRDSTKENDKARKCLLIEIPEIIFIFSAIPLLLFSFKSFESVLRIFSNLSNFKCQSEITNSKSENFPDSYF